jgi:hypothetical protein
VLWSARGFDTTCHDPAQALARIVADLKPGAILLVHENVPQNSQAELLSLLLRHLAREGYTCVLPSTEQLVRTV